MAAYNTTDVHRLNAERLALLVQIRESEKLRGKFDPYTLMLVGKERSITEQIGSIRQGEQNTQTQNLKDHAQREANMNWCIQQTLLTGRCLGNGELTGTAQCIAYRNTRAYSDHFHAYSAGLTAWPKAKYSPYSRPFDGRNQGYSPLSPEAALAAVPPFVVEGSNVPVGAGCSFATTSSTAASTGFIANATFTPGTSAAANALGAAAAIAAVQAVATSGSLSARNAAILVNKMKTAIAKSNANKRAIALAAAKAARDKRALAKLKGTR